MRTSAANMHFASQLFTGYFTIGYQTGQIPLEFPTGIYVTYPNIGHPIGFNIYNPYGDNKNNTKMSQNTNNTMQQQQQQQQRVLVTINYRMEYYHH